jgi:hypothetical protein
MIYDDIAEKLKQEYSLFLFALAGRYLTLMAPGAEVSPMMVRQMHHQGTALAQTFTSTAKALVSDFARSYTSARSEALYAQFTKMLDNITAQNINTLTQRMKGGAQNTLAGVKEAHGAIGLLLQQKMSNPDFRVKTPKGRSFDAVAYFFAEARNFAYQSWIDFTLEAIAQTSDLAEVHYPSPDHATYGTVFSISGKTPGYKSFEEVKLLFHYNSTAFPHDHVPS